MASPSAVPRSRLAGLAGLVAVILAPVLAAPAIAQWQPNGVQLSDTCCVESRGPFIRPDSLGGAYVFWLGLTGCCGGSIYAQRLLPGGYYAPGWARNGMLVSGLSYDPSGIVGLAPDGAGGWYVGHGRAPGGNTGELRLQRLAPNGLPAPGWPADGLFVGPVYLFGQGSLCPDGSGGVYYAWDQNVRTAPDVRMTRVLGNGALATGWTAPGGVAVCSLSGTQEVPVCVADDSGGVIVGWLDLRSGSGDIYCQRLHSDGTFAPGWPATGLPVCTAINLQGATLLGTTDRAGGAYFAWADSRNAPPGVPPSLYEDVYMSRVRPAGTIGSGFPVNGLPVSVMDGGNGLVDLQSDAAGNAFLCWGRQAGAYVQKVLPDGTLAWGVNGIKASTLRPGGLIPDGRGGAYVALMDGNTFVVYVQHLLPSGQPAPGWGAVGLPVTVTPTVQDYPAICSDGAGGCIVEWLDNRSGADPTSPVGFAQQFTGSGPVPVELSLVRAAATQDQVQLEWYTASSNLSDPKVERRTATSVWAAVGIATVDGAGHIRYTDRAVTAGTRYDYRLMLADAALSTSSEVWVNVPAAQLALAGLRPNPAHGTPSVAFTLPSGAPATLELLDLSGRRVALRDVGGLGAGAHLLRLEEAAALAPGLYWLRLAQGARVVQVRGAVLP